MAKKKKNSNYVTEKRANAAAEREAQEKKQHVKKLVKKAVPLFLASLALVGLLIGFAFIIGIFDYYPEASSHVSITLEYVDAEGKTQSGSLHVELYGGEADAPETVEHFEKLVKDKYFNNMTFHKFEDGLLYGGSLTADGGDNGIVGETNEIACKRGVIYMARGEDRDSAYGQFFIVTDDEAELDGEYTAFAAIDEDGMALIDAIAALAGEDGSFDKRPVIKSVSAHESH